MHDQILICRINVVFSAQVSPGSATASDSYHCFGGERRPWAGDCAASLRALSASILWAVTFIFLVYRDTFESARTKLRLHRKYSNKLMLT